MTSDVYIRCAAIKKGYKNLKRFQQFSLVSLCAVIFLDKIIQVTGGSLEARVGGSDGDGRRIVALEAEGFQIASWVTMQSSTAPRRRIRLRRKLRMLSRTRAGRSLC